MAGILIGVVVVGLLVANALLTGGAERRVAERVESAIGSDADVQLDGWPVGPKVLSGQPLDARIVARDVPLAGTSAALTLLVVELDDVVVPEGAEPLRSQRGRFTAEFDAAAVQQLVGIVGRLPLTDVELRNGVARLQVVGFPVIDATAELSDGEVAFRPTTPLASLLTVSLQIEALPLDLEPATVRIREDVLRLEGPSNDLLLP